MTHTLYSIFADISTQFVVFATIFVNNGQF